MNYGIDLKCSPHDQEPPCVARGVTREFGEKRKKAEEEEEALRAV